MSFPFFVLVMCMTKFLVPELPIFTMSLLHELLSTTIFINFTQMDLINFLLSLLILLGGEATGVGNNSYCYFGVLHAGRPAGGGTVDS